MAQDFQVRAASDLFVRISQTPAVQSLARRLEKGELLSLPTVAAPAQPYFAALLRNIFPLGPIVVVTADLKTQESFQQDLETWMRVSGLALRGQKFDAAAQADRVFFYPPWEILPHEGKLPHGDVISDRLETLIALTNYAAPTAFHETRNTRHAPIIVTSVTALLQKTYRPKELKQRARALKRGDQIVPLDLVEWLEEQGYEPEAQVTQRGEIALRGGILDLWPLTSPWPVRLEFFGDELESLRYFDPLTQISREEITSVILPPAGELGVLKSKVQSPRLKDADLATLPDYLPHGTVFLLSDPEQLALHADEYAQQIPAGDPFLISWEELLELIRTRGMAALELSENVFPLTLALSPKERDNRPPSHDTANDGIGRIDSAKKQAGRALCPLPPGEGQSEGDANNFQECALSFSNLDAFRPLAERTPELPVAEAQRREFFSQLHRWLRQGYAVHVFCNNEGERQRFEEIWSELAPSTVQAEAGALPAQPPPPTAPPREIIPKKKSQSFRQDAGSTPPGAAGILPADQTSKDPAERPLIPRLHLGSISRGFLCDEARLVVVTDAEIFGRYKIQRPRRMKSPHALATRSALDIDFTELEEGDLVVHLQHGIGRYLGLKSLPATSGNRQSSVVSHKSDTECLVIEYAPANPGDEPPKLYVPVTEAHLVSKYVGAGKVRPPLNTLSGTRWQKAKAQAERAVRDVAAELLAIQAARETQEGHAFAADTAWQREFETAFIYEETPDQWRAIQETKADLEKPKPMDRLICGDVGFGKTEVAIRAAFKGVMDGKQVAVLVPTTVLAQQHFNTFRERMADYPIRIELLSRFRTRRQQERVVKDLANGSVDIVIGTHRLIQSDIAFKDLGLVVIDEEQRFGVLHKEKFKRLRTLVDVLTLSATPIPRTLYLALTGARDMSTIQTPPHDRLPVETIVLQYDERVIRDAIQRELNRGGQVFFLHNRVLTIEAIRAKLQTLLPHARIVVGHGQMHSDDLEEVMTKFVNAEADVLLSTTIIESGLDIPNANTIIIDHADRFGLSDLYQLRGRVGRYKHQAHAYLLLPRHARLLTDVRKRISAMRQFSTLGSGFKIAMRDLEIRGVGNLLGAEQSGHITAVGFDLYCQLLKQSVASLKGETVKSRVEVTVRMDFLETGSDANGSSDVSRVQSSVNHRTEHATRNTRRASLPHSYIPEPQHRIEIYRKLAQATDKAALENLSKELRDRFGPLPAPVQLLLQVAELKTLAAERSITEVEVKDDKLMLTRHGDFITLAGKFPRLTKKDPKARVKEIKKLLSAL